MSLEKKMPGKKQNVSHGLEARTECLHLHSGPRMYRAFPEACWVSPPVWFSLLKAILLMSCLPSVMLDYNVLQLISQ